MEFPLGFHSPHPTLRPVIAARLGFRARIRARVQGVLSLWEPGPAQHQLAQRVSPAGHRPSLVGSAWHMGVEETQAGSRQGGPGAKSQAQQELGPEREALC